MCTSDGCGPFACPWFLGQSNGDRDNLCSSLLVLEWELFFICDCVDRVLTVRGSGGHPVVSNSRGRKSQGCPPEDSTAFGPLLLIGLSIYPMNPCWNPPQAHLFVLAVWSLDSFACYLINLIKTHYWKWDWRLSASQTIFLLNPYLENSGLLC